MTRLAQTARVLEAVQAPAPFHNQQAENLGVAAWRAVDSFTAQSVPALRQEYRTLLEMQDMIARALRACEAVAEVQAS